MNMTVWNPLQEMENMLDRYSQAIGRSIADSDTNLEFAEWSPTVDIEGDAIIGFVRFADTTDIVRSVLVTYKYELNCYFISSQRILLKKYYYYGPKGSFVHSTLE